jgi:hypothetical protein
MTAVVELRIRSAVEPWERMGLQVVHGVARIGGVTLRFEPGDEGVVAWGLADSPTQPDAIDGLPTFHVEPHGEPSHVHPLRILGFDHLVVMTSSLERTCGAIQNATGEELRRVREAGPVRQGFHRLGELIVEVVETAQVAAPEAAFWGFVWNVEDLYDACDHIGPELVSLPKPAVQGGRFIATVKPSAGLGVPLALMTPR